SLDVPFAQLEAAKQRALLHGTGETWVPLEESRGRSAGRTAGPHFQYKGLFPAIDEASRVSFVYRHKLDHLVSEVPCSTCGGSRLRDDAAAYRFAGHALGQLCNLPLGQTLAFFNELKLTKAQQQVVG